MKKILFILIFSPIWAFSQTNELSNVPRIDLVLQQTIPPSSLSEKEAISWRNCMKGMILDCKGSNLCQVLCGNEGGFCYATWNLSCIIRSVNMVIIPIKSLIPIQ